MIKIIRHIKSPRVEIIKNRLNLKDIISSLKNKGNWSSILEKRIKVNRKIIELQSGHS